MVFCVGIRPGEDRVEHGPHARGELARANGSGETVLVCVSLHHHRSVPAARAVSTTIAGAQQRAAALHYVGHFYAAGHWEVLVEDHRDLGSSPFRFQGRDV